MTQQSVCSSHFNWDKKPGLFVLNKQGLKTATETNSEHAHGCHEYIANADDHGVVYSNQLKYGLLHVVFHYSVVEVAHLPV